MRWTWYSICRWTFFSPTRAYMSSICPSYTRTMASDCFYKQKKSFSKEGLSFWSYVDSSSAMQAKYQWRLEFLHWGISPSWDKDVFGDLQKRKLELENALMIAQFELSLQPFDKEKAIRANLEMLEKLNKSISYKKQEYNGIDRETKRPSSPTSLPSTEGWSTELKVSKTLAIAEWVIPVWSNKSLSTTLKSFTTTQLMSTVKPLGTKQGTWISPGSLRMTSFILINPS